MDTTIGSDRPVGTENRIQGFLEGQAIAYCERVNTGSGLAAQLVCPSGHADDLVGVIQGEGCKALIVPHESSRVSIWIYRDELVRQLIDALAVGGNAKLGAFTMGKLFGYSDRCVLDF